MNPVEQAERAFNEHMNNPNIAEAVTKLTGGSSELFIGFRALWELNWIRKEWKPNYEKTNQEQTATALA
jgi:hypothetical protein